MLIFKRVARSLVSEKSRNNIVDSNIRAEAIEMRVVP